MGAERRLSWSSSLAVCTRFKVFLDPHPPCYTTPMRIFNTSGPCDPARHYTVMREGLVAQGQRLVEQGRYFTLFAPRQSGKTTYFQLLFRQLSQQGYLPIWISFESLKTATRAQFYKTLHWYLQSEFAQVGIQIEQPIENQIDLQMYLAQASLQSAPLVLVIDEFEDIPEVVKSEVLHTFRALYQKRDHHKLHSVLLVGVSSLAQLVVSSASPFNIVDQLAIPYFSLDEVQELVAQYVSESGQPFDATVIQAIYENTSGQPGLVSALCDHLVTQVVTDPTQPVTMAAFYPTLQYFLTKRQDKNILNIIEKAREKLDFMLRLLFSNTPISFTIDHPDIAYLYAHGVIDEAEGQVIIPVPLYHKRLITALRPLVNGEASEYFSAHEKLSDYAQGDRLQINAIIDKYRDYVQRRGFQAFDTEHLKEGAWHYSLDGFINFFIERLGGQTFVEVPSGRGRTDILILYRGHKYIIETKIFIDASYFEHGKSQLADYLASEGLAEGFYVGFTSKHSATDTLYFDEMIKGKRIYTWLIRTDFKAPSRRVARGRKKKSE